MIIPNSGVNCKFNHDYSNPQPSTNISFSSQRLTYSKLISFPICFFFNYSHFLTSILISFSHFERSFNCEQQILVNSTRVRRVSRVQEICKGAPGNELSRKLKFKPPRQPTCQQPQEVDFLCVTRGNGVAELFFFHLCQLTCSVSDIISISVSASYFKGKYA